MSYAEELGADSRVHVNLFPSTLLAEDATEVDRILQAAHGKQRFCIELSEQQFVGSSPALRERLDGYREQGYRIALDDVGSGRAALESLIAIEPEVVKIDASLVRDVDRKMSARGSLQRLVSMPSGSGVDIIVYGVERESQRAVLEELGIERAQGFLLSRPMGAAPENGDEIRLR